MFTEFSSDKDKLPGVTGCMLISPEMFFIVVTFDKLELLNGLESWLTSCGWLCWFSSALIWSAYGLSLSSRACFGPDTIKLRFLHSAFNSATLRSSIFVAFVPLLDEEGAGVWLGAGGALGEACGVGVTEGVGALELVTDGRLPRFVSEVCDDELSLTCIT